MNELVSALLGLLALIVMLPITAAVLICSGGSDSGSNPQPPANIKRPAPPPKPPKKSNK